MLEHVKEKEPRRRQVSSAVPIKLDAPAAAEDTRAEDINELVYDAAASILSAAPEGIEDMDIEELERLAATSDESIKIARIG